MKQEEWFEFLDRLMAEYPDSYRQGNSATVVIFESDVYLIGVSLAKHPYSEESLTLVLELLFKSVPPLRLDFSTKRKIHRINKKIAGPEGFEIRVGPTQGQPGCVIGKNYYSIPELDDLEKDRALISSLAILAFQALSKTQ